MKICLDAGHFGKTNRSPANKNYYESEGMWKLQSYLKKELEDNYGVKVKCTRSSQSKNLDLYKRGQMAKGYDLFISLHSNAIGGVVSDNIDYPLAVVMLNGKSSDIGFKLAKVVEESIGTKQSAKTFTRRGSKGEYYGVLRGADSVGVAGIILEHSFHTNSKVTEWLLSDENLKLLASKEAECIANHYGISKKDNEFKPYIVRVKIDNLNIRTGAGTNHSRVGYTGKGSFTIVDERSGEGASKWGLLKSYEGKRNGWISLDYVEKI